MRFDRVDWRVYVIVDPASVDHDEALMWSRAAAAVAAGAGVLQLRDKVSSGGVLLERARKLRELCEAHGALAIINDRVDIAVLSGAHGVHLGPDDVPVDVVRRAHPDLLIGASAGTLEDAQALVAQGADYLGVGALFDARASKPNASAPRGPEVLEEITASLAVPIVGIGGITCDNAPLVRAAGAAGVAVIRAVMGQVDPASAVEKLRGQP